MNFLSLLGLAVRKLTAKVTSPVSARGPVASTACPNPPSDRQPVFPPAANLHITHLTLFFSICFNMPLQVLFWEEVWFLVSFFLAKI